MKNLILSDYVNPAGKPVDAIHKEENRRKSMKEGYSLVIIDGLYLPAANDIFHKTGIPLGLLSSSAWALQSIELEPAWTRQRQSS